MSSAARPRWALREFVLATLGATAVAWPLAAAARRFLTFDLLAIDGIGPPVADRAAEAFAAFLVTALAALAIGLPARWLAARGGRGAAWRGVGVLLAAAASSALFEAVTPWPLLPRERLIVAALAVALFGTFEGLSAWLAGRASRPRAAGG